MPFCMSIINKVRETFPEAVIFKIGIKEVKERRRYREAILV